MSHISFDVWNTLISANPHYAIARTKYLSEVYSGDPDKIKKVYSTVKDRFDSNVERDHTSDSVYRTLNKEIYTSLNLTPRASLDEIRDTLAMLFLEHPPVILGGMIDALQEVSKKYTLSIGSNSNFISGRVMHPFLVSKFGDIFTFSVYSDLINAAKPSKTFFEHVIHHANVLPRNIIHIGDDVVCDYEGPTSVGINAFVIKNPLDLLIYKDLI